MSDGTSTSTTVVDALPPAQPKKKSSGSSTAATHQDAAPSSMSGYNVALRVFALSMLSPLCCYALKFVAAMSENHLAVFAVGVVLCFILVPIVSYFLLKVRSRQWEKERERQESTQSAFLTTVTSSPSTQ